LKEGAKVVMALWLATRDWRADVTRAPDEGCRRQQTTRGQTVTRLDEEDRTPLLLAVKGNYGEVASALVRAGADLNTPCVDEDGERTTF
jgi:ankyrin repeat protein